MCCKKELFIEYEKLNVAKSVEIENGATIKGTGIGKIVVEANVEEKWVETHLINVLYVPDLKYNLFSTGSVLDKGYRSVSDDKKYLFKNKSGEVCATAERESNLSKMLFRYENKNKLSIANVSKVKYNLKI